MPSVPERSAVIPMLFRDCKQPLHNISIATTHSLHYVARKEVPAALVPLRRRNFINWISAIKIMHRPAFAGAQSKESFYSSTLFLCCLNREIEKRIHFLWIGKVQLLQFIPEQVTAALAIKHFSGVTIDEVLGQCGVMLCFLFHAFPFGKVSAQEFIIILVTAAFMRCLRMAVEHRDAEIIKTVLVGKFAAVVAGNGQKQFIKVSAEFSLQALHCFSGAVRGFIGHFQHNFLSGHSFRDDKAGFFFTFTTADYTVNFPVAEGLPEVYIFRTLFNTAVQGVSCTDRLFICLYGIFPLFGMSDRQVFITDVGDKALRYVAVKCLLGDCQAVDVANQLNGSVGAVFLFNTGRNGSGIRMVIAQL